METFSALLALWAGNSPVTGEFPSHRPVTRSFDFFFDVRLNKRLSKQSIRRWFETPSSSLWRHCNAIVPRQIWRQFLMYISCNIFYWSIYIPVRQQAIAWVNVNQVLCHRFPQTLSNLLYLNYHRISYYFYYSLLKQIDSNARPPTDTYLYHIPWKNMIPVSWLYDTGQSTSGEVQCLAAHLKVVTGKSHRICTKIYYTI